MVSHLIISIGTFGKLSQEQLKTQSLRNRTYVTQPLMLGTSIEILKSKTFQRDCCLYCRMSWLVDLSHQGPKPMGEVPSVGGLSKGSQPIFTRVSEKTTENSERLGRQARPGFEPGTFRLPVLNVTAMPLVGQTLENETNIRDN